jgi:hypothetical protein
MQLIDVSRTGARLTGEALPAVGVQLTFQADAVSACGDVIWSEAQSCAIEFETPIAASEVLWLRARAAI